MRVVYPGDYKPDSANGVNKSIARWASHLRQEGVEVALWNFTPEASEPAERLVDGVAVWDLPCGRSVGANLFQLPRSTRAFMHERAQQVDLFHLHSVFRPDNLHVARLGRPFVLTPHSGYNTLGHRHKIAKWLWCALWEKDLARRARAVHAVAEGEVGYLRQFAPDTPVVTITYGEDEPQRRARTRAERRAGWLFVGRLDIEHKGLDLLLEGYALLKRDAQVTALPPLTLVGPDHRGGRARLEGLAGALGIRSEVCFAGPLYGDEKTEAMLRAALFVHTSRWEGMPFAIKEALALGTPVLVTPETNIADYVSEYGAGWVTAGTPGAIADGLRCAMRVTSPEMETMSGQARALIADHFTWASSARQMAAWYRSVA